MAAENNEHVRQHRHRDNAYAQETEESRIDPSWTAVSAVQFLKRENSFKQA